MNNYAENTRKKRRLAEEKYKIQELDSFSKTIFDFIQRHEGVSTISISKFYLKRKDQIIPVLEGLREKGLAVYDRGNWYFPINKSEVQV